MNWMQEGILADLGGDPEKKIISFREFCWHLTGGGGGGRVKMHLEDKKKSYYYT